MPQQQQQTLVIGQQQTVNMNTTNTQPTTQGQWSQQQTLTIQRTIQQPIDQRQVIWSQQSPVSNISLNIIIFIFLLLVLILIAYYMVLSMDPSK